MPDAETVRFATELRGEVLLTEDELAFLQYFDLLEQARYALGAEPPPASHLLGQFLSEECTPHVRKLLSDALAERSSGRATRELELNRFNVILDFERGLVVIEDELDVTPAGTVQVTIGEFVAALAR